VAALLAPLALRDRRPSPAPGPAPRRAVRLEALLREQERLAAEIAALRRLTTEPAPLVYLGGDEQTDVLLDLERLARRRQSEIRPASLSPARNR
jgi:hypothetical protein